MSKVWGPVILELIPAATFFTNNDDFLLWTDLRARPRSIRCRDTSSTSSSPLSGALWTRPITAAGARPSTARRVSRWDTRVGAAHCGAVRESQSFNQILRQQRRLTVAAAVTFGRPGSSAVPLGWRAVGKHQFHENCPWPVGVQANATRARRDDQLCTGLRESFFPLPQLPSCYFGRERSEKTIWACYQMRSVHECVQSLVKRRLKVWRWR